MSEQGWGEALDRSRHPPAVKIKGATYTELRVWQETDGTWHARCVVDVCTKATMNLALLSKISDTLWRIAPHGPMRVPGLLFGDCAPAACANWNAISTLCWNSPLWWLTCWKKWMRCAPACIAWESWNEGTASRLATVAVPPFRW